MYGAYSIGDILGSLEGKKQKFLKGSKKVSTKFESGDFRHLVYWLCVNRYIT